MRALLESAMIGLPVVALLGAIVNDRETKRRPYDWERDGC